MGRRANGEGSEYVRHGSRWRCRVSVDGRRVWVSAATKAELRRRVADAVAAGESGLPAVVSRDRLGGYIDQWIGTSLAARDVAPGTRRLYASHLRTHVVPVLGQVRLGELRAGHVELLHARLIGLGRSDSVRRSAHTALSLVCDTAVRDGLIRGNPCALVDRPADPPKRQASYSLAEAVRLVDAAEGLRTLGQLVPVLLYTAVRVGEALALRWSDVDWERRRVLVCGTLAVGDGGRVFRADYLKGGRPVKVVPLVPQAVAALQAARAAQVPERLAAGSAWEDLDLVFADQLGGLVDDRSLRKPYRELLRGLGLRGSFHALRRSAATVLTEAGVPLPVVSAILGHSSGRVTQAHYVVVSEGPMRAALELAFGQDAK